ncbi:MAG: hypothetical protein U9N57_14715 [Pseudomonadota bacterium]|nr:hypothetical protein [Pseudomonadota bacterium]
MIRSKLKLALPIQSLLVFFILSLPAQMISAETVVIGNSQIKIENISSKSLGRIYAMQVKNWPDGQKIKVFTYSTQKELYRDFVISETKMQPHQLERLWNRLIFTGTGRAPIVVGNEKEMLQKIRMTPGAIGYVEATENLSGIKSLEVEK